MSGRSPSIKNALTNHSHDETHYQVSQEHSEQQEVGVVEEDNDRQEVGVVHKHSGGVDEDSVIVSALNSSTVIELESSDEDQLLVDKKANVDKSFEKQLSAGQLV